MNPNEIPDAFEHLKLLLGSKRDEAEDHEDPILSGQLNIVLDMVDTLEKTTNLILS